MSEVSRFEFDGVQYVRAADFDRLNSYFNEDLSLTARTDEWSISVDKEGNSTFTDCAITCDKDITVSGHEELVILAVIMQLRRMIDSLRDKEHAEHIHGTFMSGSLIRGSLNNPQLPPFSMDRLTGSILKGTK